VIVDASALCAILLNESDGAAFAKAIARARKFLISPLQVWETCVSVSRELSGDRSDQVNLAIDSFRIEIADLGSRETLLALEAWRRFGKGRHPAGLNLGDCFAYALAKSRGLPLLYKGDDFSKTDVRPAI